MAIVIEVDVLGRVTKVGVEGVKGHKCEDITSDLIEKLSGNNVSVSTTTTCEYDENPETQSETVTNSGY